MDLPETEFNRMGGGRQYWCRECFRRYFRDRGDVHLAQVKASKQARKAPLYRQLVDHLRAHPCLDCGEADLVVLDFDHTGGGEHADVSSLLAKAVRPERFEAEIARCEVVCATAAAAGWFRAAEAADGSSR
jgi:hypothetical protein